MDMIVEPEAHLIQFVDVDVASWIIENVTFLKKTKGGKRITKILLELYLQ